MNLRLQGNHLRLRVTQSDLEAFRARGRIESATRFGEGAALTCALAADRAADAPTVRFSEQQVTVRVPAPLAEEWATTDRVGFEAEQPAGDGHTLHLSVEKDFGCQHKGDPGRADKFTQLAEQQRAE